jgi:transcriptional regulator with XRE-family HTH domain
VSEIRAPNPVDKHVGSRVRMRRRMLAISQEKLGHALGLTFQQVQKYEKGTNRIGASRLEQIARILQVPVGFFFEVVSDASVTGEPDERTRLLDEINQFISSPEGLRLVQAFLRIENPDVRRRVVALVQEIASDDQYGV